MSFYEKGVNDMAYFKKTFLLTDEEKRKVADMSGKIMLWILEGRSIDYMSDNLKLKPSQINYNIIENLYVLRKQVGRWQYLKVLFMK